MIEIQTLGDRFGRFIGGYRLYGWWDCFDNAPISAVPAWVLVAFLANQDVFDVDVCGHYGFERFSCRLKRLRFTIMADHWNIAIKRWRITGDLCVFEGHARLPFRR